MLNYKFMVSLVILMAAILKIDHIGNFVPTDPVLNRHNQCKISKKSIILFCFLEKPSNADMKFSQMRHAQSNMELQENTGSCRAYVDFVKS